MIDSIRRLFKYPVFLLLPAPFSHWMGSQLSLVYILTLFTVFLIPNLYKKNTSIKKITLFCIATISVYTLTAIVRFEGNLEKWFQFGPNDQTFLLVQTVQFFVIISIISLAKAFERSEIKQFAGYFYFVLVSTAMFESLLTNFFGVPQSFFPAYFESYAYNAPVIGNYYRPFGLTGNAPIHATMIVISMWIYFGFSETKAKTTLAIHIITFFALSIMYSGQAFIAYILSLIYYYFRARPLNIFILLISLFIIHIIFQNQILGSRMSYDYILRVLKELSFEETFYSLSSWDIVFGALGKELELHTEFYPLYFLARSGIIIILIIIFLFLRGGYNKKIKAAYISVIIGSLHYGTFMLAEIQFLLALIILYYYNKEKSIAQSPHYAI